jgi:transcription elongation factor Elf1
MGGGARAMIEELSEEKVAEYLQAPIKCPYCGSDNITSGHIEGESTSAWADVTCNACGAYWRDIYTLTSIIEEMIGGGAGAGI